MTEAARRWRREHFRALFDPCGVVVAGASTHPGKFGFVALHNILAAGYRGRVFATNREAAAVLGVAAVATIDELPAREVDLAVVCTPAAVNEGLLRACAAKGIKAAYVASAGYGEAGADGAVAQRRLTALAAELDLLVVGPNGQGVLSTPSALCAQIVAPHPPAGRIGIASQSGNVVSSFANYARHHGVGVSRAVSVGNAAAVGVVDFLDFYAGDPETAVGLAYLEGVVDGRAVAEGLRAVVERLPVVLVKGGATAAGARAAASHTGSLATDDRVFDGAVRQTGAVRAASIEEAYDLAATFATQPLPRGGRVAVVTTAGGWGVMASDAINRERGLELAPVPDDLMAALDAELPDRWSRGNPVDLAGGETRDTLPEVLGLVARHPSVDAVVLLGTGIQANQARFEREGAFFPDHGLGRIVDYHERQDRRFVTVAAELSREVDKPILAATELAVTDRENAAVAGCRDAGVLCYASADRAVTALAALRRHARWREARGLGPTGRRLEAGHDSP
ncbi:MAG: CoA-binding protein [Acidimicrobiia bacterium]|nr:CoA-binding protein [Acidimicrobiia bacterium]